MSQSQEVSEQPDHDPSELVLYQTDDGTTRVHIRLFEGTVWLTQKQLSELYQVAVSTVSEHLHNLFDEGEAVPEATVRKFRTVRSEGDRSVSRTLDHYSLPVVLAVGYRVRSARGTQFRQWATTRLEEYVIKGFTLDDQRLKSSPGLDAPDYFEELLERIRDIRSSEKVFYRKVLDIYATSVDYDKRSEVSQRFFAEVQNKLHWAAHGHTAAELIAERADATKPNMGLTSWAGSRPRRGDVVVAKNYLAPGEIDALNRIVSAFLEFAELQASNRRPMHMADWSKKLDQYLTLAERAVLDHPSAITHDDAAAKARQQLDRYDAERARLPSLVEAHFDDVVREVAVLARQRKRAPKQHA